MSAANLDAPSHCYPTFNRYSFPSGNNVGANMLPPSMVPDTKSSVIVSPAHHVVHRTTYDVDVVMQEDKTPNSLLVTLQFVLQRRSYGMRWG